MSKDIIILIPNGRRVKIHCTPDTSFLQVLEDVCEKQGYEASGYNLKHHNNILDLTTTIRFCNIPNKATLEMVEADKKRVEANVTVGLLLDDGERRTAEFNPSTFLYDLVISLAGNEIAVMKNPTVMYMRQEVIGIPALKEKTLKHLGLIAGRAVLRLLDKTETTQANVSSVYRAKSEKPKSEEISLKTPLDKDIEEPSGTGDDGKTSTAVQKDKDIKTIDPIKLIKSVKMEDQHKDSTPINENTTDDSSIETIKAVNNAIVKPDCSKQIVENKSSNTLETQEELERRLKIEEEVTFVGSQKAVAFMQPDETRDELSDLPDDFYELSIEEVRKIYHELQQRRIEFENTPLLTTTKRQELEKQASQQKMNTYKHVVVRIQFPDNMILQGVFTPSNTIQDVNNFVQEHLQNPNKPFQIFTTPLKETLNPNTSLLDAKFVPCVHMHFRWLEENSQSYLKEDIYLKQTSSDAASILASKYRAPTRRKLETTPGSSNAKTSTSKESKLPKWFKK